VNEKALAHWGLLPQKQKKSDSIQHNGDVSPEITEFVCTRQEKQHVSHSSTKMMTQHSEDWHCKSLLAFS
jgi:hypothetical protein